MAGAMPGTASMLKSANRFSLGNLASLMRRGAAPFGAVVDLGGQDLGQVPQVGVAFPVGELGQADRFGTHGGQVQLACRGADGGLRGGIDDRRIGARHRPDASAESTPHGSARAPPDDARRNATPSPPKGSPGARQPAAARSAV